jgi:hypothetical protein
MLEAELALVRAYLSIARSAPESTERHIAAARRSLEFIRKQMAYLCNRCEAAEIIEKWRRLTAELERTFPTPVPALDLER